MNDERTVVPVEAVPVEVFAKLTSLSRSLVYRAFSTDPAERRGMPHLPSVKVGKARRVRLEDGRAWLRSMTEAGQAAA